MINLFGKTLSELTDIVTDESLPKFTAKQIADWLYKKNIDSIDEMTNLAKKTREHLKKKYTVGKSKHLKVQTSKDGTMKYLFPADKNLLIETAYIPEDDRATICVSSQVGCRYGCKFCFTGKQGFQNNLTSGEILNQFASLPEKDKITNIVYMGMGEPFDNLNEVMKSLEIFTSSYGFGLSSRRITVSSIGVIPGIDRFMKESKCRFALSLHSPFEEERKKLMPVENRYSLQRVIKALKKYDFDKHRRLSFEYILFKDLNDSKKHAEALADIAKDFVCRVNLINYHSDSQSKLKRTDNTTALRFQEVLTKRGILTTIRKSRGQDIDAACGMLSTKEKNIIKD